MGTAFHSRIPSRLLVSAMTLLALFAAAIWAGNFTAHAAEDSQELVFLAWGEEERYSPIIEAFEERHPGVDVTFIGGPYGEHLDKFQVMVASGSPPDIALIDGYDYATAAIDGLIMDVTQWAERDGITTQLEEQYYNPGYLQELQVNGRYFSVAQLLTSRLMVFYNKGMVSELGFQDINDMGADWTWATFLELAKKATQDTNNDGAPEQSGIKLNRTQFWPWVLMNGGRLLSEDGSYSPFDQAATYEGFQWFADLRLVHDVTGGVMEDGTAAMKANWASAELQRLKEVDFEWDIAAYPAGKAGSITIAKGNELVIPYNAANKEVAWEFMKFSASEEGNYIYGSNQTFFPPRRDAALRVLETNREEYPEHFESLLEAQAQPLPVTDGFRELYNLWSDELLPVWEGTETAKSAGERIAELSAGILSKARQDN